MIRLLAALGAFLFMSLWFLGEDHGQFINPPQAAVRQVHVAQPAARKVFIPAQPVMQPAAAPPPIMAATAVEPPAPDLAPAPATQPEPELAAIKVMHVPGGASVRAGPGRSFGIVGALSAGDVVMVVDDTTSTYWVRIRVDGQGEGWVAAKLLRE